jgi:hypothetical protein
MDKQYGVKAALSISEGNHGLLKSNVATVTRKK